MSRRRAVGGEKREKNDKLKAKKTTLELRRAALFAHVRACVSLSLSLPGGEVLRVLCVCVCCRHVKDLVILTSGTVVLGTISSYFWLLWLLVRSLKGVLFIITVMAASDF